MNIPKVVHILPYDAIGGVEVAAKTVPDGDYTAYTFEKCYLVAKPGVSKLPAITPHKSESDPRMIFAGLLALLRKKPAVAIGSLWRGYLMLILLKLTNPSVKAVTFLHASKDAHAVDWLLSRIAMWLSTEIWADSTATTKRVPFFLRGRVQPISFLLQHVEDTTPRPVAPAFVFWGRLHAHKNLEEALEFYAQVNIYFKNSTFDIIGPDGGEAEKLKALVARRPSMTGVTFHGPLDRAGIAEIAKRCTFYLQTSVKEGAAMSVIEAMQFGLIPVVTPAGDIPTYCEDGANSFLFQTHKTMRLVNVNWNRYFVTLKRLLEQPDVAASFSDAARFTWRNKPLYRHTVLSRCRALAAPYLGPDPTEADRVKVPR